MTDSPDQRAVLAHWAESLGTELGLEQLDFSIDEILALAGIAAHAVVRPAAPLTTFLVGYAAGRSRDPDALAVAVRSALALAKSREAGAR